MTDVLGSIRFVTSAGPRVDQVSIIVRPSMRQAASADTPLIAVSVGTAGIGIQLNRGILADSAAYRAHLSEYIAAMGLNDYIKPADSGFALESISPFVGQPAPGELRDPADIRIRGFSTRQEAMESFQSLLESGVHGSVNSLETTVWAASERFEMFRPELNQFCEGWYASSVGMLDLDVDPFADPSSLPPDAPDYVPMYSFESNRKIRGHPYEANETFACAVLRRPEGLRIEFSSDTDDTTRLLDIASRATGGVSFELVQADDPRVALK